jgi:hypothetical protein
MIARLTGQYLIVGSEFMGGAGRAVVVDGCHRSVRDFNCAVESYLRYAADDQKARAQAARAEETQAQEAQEAQEARAAREVADRVLFNAQIVKQLAQRTQCREAAEARWAAQA